MAQPIGFEQDPDAPDGAGMFHFDTGRSVYAYEPEEAKRISARLTEAPDGRMAGPAADPWYDDPQDPIDRATGRSIPAPNPSARLPENAQPAGAPPMQARGPTTDEVVAAAKEQARFEAADELLHGKRVSAAGRNPMRERETGIMVPKGSTTVTEGAQPYDPEMAEQRVQADKKVLDVQLAGLDMQQQQMRAQAAAAAAAQPELERKAAEAQSYRARAIEGFRQKRQALEDDLREYESAPRPDPSNFWQSKGAFAGVGMAIAQALGAYAATLGKTPNFAMEIIQRGIDRDVEAQKEELRRGRASRANALARYTEMYGGDVDQAEEAVRIAQLKLSQNEALRYGAESGIPQIQQQADLMAAELERQIVNREQKMFNDHMGKSTTTVANEFVQPRAGGVRRAPLSATERAAAMKLLGDDGKPANIPSSYSDNPKQFREHAIQYGNKRAELAQGEDAIRNFAEKAGIGIDEKTGAFKEPEGGVPGMTITHRVLQGPPGDDSLPSKVAKGISVATMGQRGRDVQQAKSFMVQQYVKAMTGASSTDSERARYESAANGIINSEGIVRGAETMMRQIRAKRQEIDAGYGPDIVRYHNEKTGEITTMRNSSPANEVEVPVGRVR